MGSKTLKSGKNNFKYEHLYRTYFIPLCIFSQKFDLSKEDAKDIVQECFLKLIHSNCNFPDETSIKAYLYTSVKNASLMFIRKQKHKTHYRNTASREDLSTSSALADIIENEVYREMAGLIELLPPQCKKIFLSALEGKTSNIIAREMGLSEETVKTQRKKARAILKAACKNTYSSLILFFSIHKIWPFFHNNC